jgi:hypothetical protein
MLEAGFELAEAFSCVHVMRSLLVAFGVFGLAPSAKSCRQLFLAFVPGGRSYNSFWQMFIVFGCEFLVTLACRARVRDTIMMGSLRDES